MARGAGTVTVRFLGDVSNLKKAAGQADSTLGKVGSSVAGMAKTAAMVGIPALVGFGAAAVKAFSESQQVAAQTEAVLKSTGGAAGVTAAGVDKLSGALSKMSGVDDELIASGQNVLLTFTKVRNEVGKGNDVFDQATKAALDMSVALGTDMKSASMLMGKALNDPIKGMTALTRSGVSFTAEQKAMVKQLVESGDTLGAQKIILKEMEVQFGGSAKAAGETFAGQLNKLKVVAGNFMEDVGSKIVPVLITLGMWLGENIPKAIDVLTPAFKTAIGVVKDVIGWVKDLVARFREGGGGISDTGDQVRGVLTQLQAHFSAVFGAIAAVVTAAVNLVKGIWRVFGDDILSFAREFIAALLETFRGFSNAIAGIFDLIKAIFTGKWGDAWTAIKKIVDGVWDGIFGVIRNAVTNVIPTILAGLGQAVSSVARTAFDGLKEAFKGAMNWIIDKFNNFKIPGIKVAGLTVSPEVNFPNLPRFHQGGVVPGPSGADVLGVLRAGERVLPVGAAGGGGTTVFNITVNGWVGDDVALTRKIIAGIRREQSKSGTLVA